MAVIKLGEIVMILDMHRQGLSVSAIARQTGVDRKTIRKYIERGLEAPAYGPRKPRATVIDPFTAYLRERVAAYPGLSGRRLLRELKDRGFAGGYTTVTDWDCQEFRVRAGIMGKKDSHYDPTQRTCDTE
ncbi:transposase [Mesorhizobium sp. USDA 4775]